MKYYLEFENLEASYTLELSNSTSLKNVETNSSSGKMEADICGDRNLLRKLKIPLITISHIADCNLLNLFQVVWKLARMLDF